MKRILLCGINARYSHSCLALLCLKHAAPEGLPVTLLEFSVNDRAPEVTDAIIRARPDAVGFSCYIWNIAHVLKAASTVKKVLPECFILLGGPEVSFDAAELMEAHPFIDMVVCGPGEAPFAHFAPRFCRGEDVCFTPSACVRAGEGPRQNPAAPRWDINDTRFMYGDLSVFQNRTIYYETSRGCPFRCAYCLSADEPVSFLDTARVEQELEYFVSSGVRQVKLVDRTFNHPSGRAKSILCALIALKQKYPQSPTNFHLEISACLLDGETISLLASAPDGLLQLEIGIQSTHPETLRAVRRSHDTQAVLENAAALCALPNLRVHADLIAGLPEEDYVAFSRSFDDAYRLKPAALQLGFLKLLRGSPLRRDAGVLGIVYTEYPPYEVLSTPAMPYAELSSLHRAAELVDVLYNTGGFAMSLERFITALNSPFAFFERAAAFFSENGFFDRPQPPQRAFELLAALAAQLPDAETLREALCFDWCCRGEGGVWPRGVNPPAAPEPQELRRFFAGPENIRKYLPRCAGLPLKRIERRCRIYAFPRLFAPPLRALFDYGLRRGDEGFVQIVAI
jgi:radical SAM superfamily enzyme YgiQ (UPF0313 family)